MGPFQCPGCGATTWGALRHCPKCGDALVRKCPACGVTWRYIYDKDYRYCPSCGSSVLRPRAPSFGARTRAPGTGGGV